MKYKVMGAVVCLAALIVSLLVPMLKPDAEPRYHQHLDAPEKEPCSHGAGQFCSHLPLLHIDTGSQEIPGANIVDNRGKIQGHATTTEGDEEIIATVSVFDNLTRNNHLEDPAQMQSKCRIHIRGNSSRSFDKPGYSLRLITETGENNPQEVMGMAAHHEWALHGPFLDKTLMRNYMWYNIAGEMMGYAPNVRFCEVFLNGEYRGVYVMTETITAGDDGARLPLSVNRKDNTYSGYLIRLDRGSSTPLKNIEPFTVYSYRTASKLNIVYPGSATLTPELQRAIESDFSDFEKALYSFDYDNEDYGYKTLIDVDSFVDFFLLTEFTCNYDAGWLSTYMYKATDGKFHMCIWDYNSACDNYNESMLERNHFETQYCLWYTMLIKDEAFVEQVIRRYRELRTTYFSEEYLYQYIDDVIAYLGDAIDRNYQRWGYTFQPEHDMLSPDDRNPRSYDEAILNLKNYFPARIEWMDQNIETLLQYSAESKVKKFNELAN